MLCMCIRSIPQLPCIWFVICIICVRGQYLDWVLHLLLFFGCCVCVEAICLYASRLHHSLVYVLLTILLYTYIHMYSHVCVCDLIHVIYTCTFFDGVLFKVQDRGGHLRIFVGKVWSSASFNKTYVIILGLLNCAICNNETSMVTMMRMQDALDFVIHPFVINLKV